MTEAATIANDPAEDAALAPEGQAALAQAVGSVQALVQSHESHVFGFHVSKAMRPSGHPALGINPGRKTDFKVFGFL